MDGGRLELRVSVSPSALDTRRGVARLHPTALQALGLKAWDVVGISGSRLTAALVALTPSGSDPAEIVLDDLTCANAGTAPGALVVVGPLAAQPASSIRLADQPPAGTTVHPGALRLALLGKVMTAGDAISLLPQDFVPTEGVGPDELSAVVASLSRSLGESWTTIAVTVAETVPPGVVRVSMETTVTWAGAQTTSSGTPMLAPPVAPASAGEAGAARAAAVADLPGLEAAAKSLQERLEIGFHRHELLSRLGSSPMLGVLVSGPPGSGKVALVNAVSAAVGASVHRLWGPALTRIEAGPAVAEIDRVIAAVEADPPAVLLIEDVDVVLPRENGGPLVSLVLQHVERLVAAAKIAVVATTAHPGEVCADLLRPGLLEQQIAIGVPQRDDRRRILEVQSRALPLGPDVRLADIALATPGYVAADLVALAREAAVRAAQRIAAAGDAPALLRVEHADFTAALEVVRPSTVDSAALVVGDITLDDVGNMESVKQVLTETVVWPLLYPDTFDRLGVAPSRGVLLHGPPGCGKTFVVRALAGSAQVNVFSVKGAELMSKWVGESERGVRDLFQRARAAAPSLVFLDEVDALAPVRGGSSDAGATDRVVAALLTELDGIEPMRDVVVVAATNRPDLVDPALLRPGRIERLVEVGPPDVASREAVLRAVTRRTPLASDVDLAAVAAATEGRSCADLEGLVREAAMTAMRENRDSPQLTAAHVAAALSRLR